MTHLILALRPPLKLWFQFLGKQVLRRSCRRPRLSGVLLELFGAFSLLTHALDGTWSRRLLETGTFVCGCFGTFDCNCRFYEVNILDFLLLFFFILFFLEEFTFLILILNFSLFFFDPYLQVFLFLIFLQRFFLCLFLRGFASKFLANFLFRPSVRPRLLLASFRAAAATLTTKARSNTKKATFMVPTEFCLRLLVYKYAHSEGTRIAFRTRSFFSIT